MHKLSFIEGKTVLHRMYPITKLFWLIFGTVLVFILTKGFLIILVALGLFIILILINPKIWKIRGFRLVISTGSILFLLYLAFEKSGKALLNPGIPWLTITTGGLDTGLRFSGRFLAIVFLSYIFILTTNPNHLAYALMKMGLPYRFGFMLVTALRLSPIMENEALTIYRAQLVRGVQYDAGNLKKMFLLIQQFLTPLLISALRRADKLVFSMEGRGFGKCPKRSFRNQTTLTSLDYSISILGIFFFALLILINFGVVS
jgi:energy-coupling factor transport system permease protein